MMETEVVGSNAFWSGLDVDQIFRKPSNDALVKWFFNRQWYRLHVLHMSFLGVWFGRHRVGKSLAAVSFSNIIDETFERDLEKRIVYMPDEFSAALNDIRKKKIIGASIVWDEAGVGYSNLRWYEEIAKQVGAQLQSCGYLSPMVHFISQDFSFINSTARKIANCVFQVERTTNQYSTIKPLYLSNTPFSSRMFRHYPLLCCDRDGAPSNIMKISSIRLTLPPESIRQRYEHVAQIFKDKLLEKSQFDIESLVQGSIGKEHRLSIDDMVDIIVKNPEGYLRRRSQPGNQIIHVQCVRNEFKTTGAIAEVVKKKAEVRLNKK